MSTLRTNALEGMDAKNSITIVAGAGNVTTTNVQEGLAKAYGLFNQTTSAADGYSLNVGSFTDASAGAIDFNFTNSFNKFLPTNPDAPVIKIDFINEIFSFILS